MTIAAATAPTPAAMTHGLVCEAGFGGWTVTQALPFQCDFPSGETAETHEAPFQYHLPSGET